MSIVVMDEEQARRVKAAVEKVERLAEGAPPQRGRYPVYGAPVNLAEAYSVFRNPNGGTPGFWNGYADAWSGTTFTIVGVAAVIGPNGEAVPPPFLATGQIAPAGSSYNASGLLNPRFAAAQAADGTMIAGVSYPWVSIDANRPAYPSGTNVTENRVSFDPRSQPFTGINGSTPGLSYDPSLFPSVAAWQYRYDREVGPFCVPGTKSYHYSGTLSSGASSITLDQVSSGFALPPNWEPFRPGDSLWINGDAYTAGGVTAVTTIVFTALQHGYTTPVLTIGDYGTVTATNSPAAGANVSVTFAGLVRYIPQSVAVSGGGNAETAAVTSWNVTYTVSVSPALTTNYTNPVIAVNYPGVMHVYNPPADYGYGGVVVVTDQVLGSGRKKVRQLSIGLQALDYVVNATAPASYAPDWTFSAENNSPWSGSLLVTGPSAAPGSSPGTQTYVSFNIPGSTHNSTPAATNDIAFWQTVNFNGTSIYVGGAQGYTGSGIGGGFTNGICTGAAATTIDGGSF